MVLDPLAGIPHLEGKAAGRSPAVFLLKMVEEEKSAELSPAQQPSLGRWARLPPGCPLAMRWARRENRAGPDERAPSRQRHFAGERRWSWLPWRLSDCGGPVLVLDKVGRLFLID